MSETFLPQDRVPQAPGGPLRDYVLRDYEPAADPAGRLHPASVLRWFLRTQGLAAARPVIDACRAHLGPDETVWGVKLLPGGRAGLELYFYGDQGAAPRAAKRVGALSRALDGVIEVDHRLDASLDYVMCSLELDAASLAAGRGSWRIYVPGTRPAHGYDGLSFLVDGGELIRENSYCFYYVPQELDRVRERVRHAPRGGGDVAGLLPGEYTDCFTICYAVKARADALYFSRLPTDRTADFLRRHWPGPLAELLTAEADALAHLRWDVGHDFAAPSTGLSDWRTAKVGLYGIC